MITTEYILDFCPSYETLPALPRSFLSIITQRREANGLHIAEVNNV